ncbi:type II toxin-antitoxin system HicB family antitoxin [Campylobacter curvus]|uniref:HicB family protein n=1 Tax=Campylobacter curvus TaxID=200 RepID=UPI000360B213|nr:HicB family protein [Campylobacter curvus]QKF60913.1 toxin-antitoxin system, antitoxin component, HicB family [Campylobacter curvus]UEB49233.1 HicB family protein [Campylobacter curvus]
MKKDVNYYLNLPYKIELKKIPENEGGGWGAFMPEFNGIAFFYGDGETKSEALEDLDAAFKFTLEGLIEDNIPIPMPAQSDKSKNLAVTIKQSLVNEIDFYAKKMGLSRSAFLAVSAKQYIKTL